ncbi:hypothetical protein ES707_05499 [subsurface metagenome]
MKIETLLKDIENKDLVLPEFQRDFVWKENDVKKYIQSIYKKYPTGSLLIWRTLNPPKTRGEQKLSEGVYTRVLLDGQQRLTTLYLFVKGKTPPYYNNMVKKYNLYFNVENEQIRYYQKTLMDNKQEWISIIDFFKQESAANYVIKNQNKDYYLKYLDTLNKLDNIRKYDYFMDEEKLTNLENIKEVVKIFNLVNKQGRTLSEEDLALAYTCSFWPEIKDLFREELSLYNKKSYFFNFNFLITCLNSIATGHAKFDSYYKASEEIIKESWTKLKEALRYLLNTLNDKAYINSSNPYELKSDALLVPIVVYLANNKYEFKNEIELNKFLYWLYNSMMWGRYTRRGKSGPLEQDVVTITREKNPESLIDNLSREVRFFKVLPRNLEKAPITSPFFNMSFVVAKSKGAIDWFNGSKLHSKLIGNSYYLEKHHIFPKNILEKRGYYQTYEKQKMVNEIGNRVFLTAKANKEISNSEPIQYLKKVKEKYPKALEQQFVPKNEEFWKLDAFELFLKKRRKKIADEINNFMEHLIDDEIIKVKIEDLVKKEESNNLEFKSTYTWNIRENKIDKDLKFNVLKSVVGFMNSNGGTLIIGVDDEHQILGMDLDFKSNWKGNKDGFILDIREYLESYIDINNYNRYIDLSFELIGDKEVCVVKVEKSFDYIYLRKNNKKILYVRLGNRTKPLDDPEEIMEYIEEDKK